MVHCFEYDIACEYGVEAAVLLHNLAFWIKKNQDDDRHFYDGRYWTYSSARSLSKSFAYIKQDKVMRIMKKLEECGVIKSWNYNKSAYDRTKWYTITDDAIMKIYKLDCEKIKNENSKNSQPIPDSITDTKTDNNTNADVEEVYNNYPSKCPINKTPTGKGSKNKEKIKKILKTKTKDELIELQDVYVKSCVNGNRYIKNYSTFLNNLPDREQFDSTCEKESNVVLFDPAEYRRRLANETR